jgi:hypothetical protein
VTFLLALIPIIHFNVGYTVLSTNIYLGIFIFSLLFLAYFSCKKAAILESPIAIILIVLFAPGGILAITIMLLVNYFKRSEPMERAISNKDIQTINKFNKFPELRVKKDRRMGNTVLDPDRDRRKGERRINAYKICIV